MPEVELAVPDGFGEGFALLTPDMERPKNSSIMFNGDYSWPLEHDVTWGYTSGVKAQTLAVSMAAEYAEYLIQNLGPDVTLTMKSPLQETQDDEGEFEFAGLWLLVDPVASHWSRSVIIADDRWYWDRQKVSKVYNLTRRSNDVFSLRTAGDEFDRELLLRATQYFVPSTIRYSEEEGFLGPYSALDIVVDVLTNFLGYPAEKINLTQATTSAYVPQNIYIEGEAASSVIQRFLTLSGNNLYFDKDGGTIYVYDQQEPVTEAVYQQLFPGGEPPKASGALRVTNYKAMRPHLVEVQSSVEKEILFTYVEQSTSAQTTASDFDGPATDLQEAAKQIQEGQVYVENVTKTVVPDQVPGLPRGAYVTIEEALEAFGTRYGSGTLTLSDLQAYYGAGMAAFVAGAIKSSASADWEFDPQATVIFSSIMRDYRTLFRIPQVVLDQLMDWKPELVDVLNEETGQRAESEVFSAVTWVTSVKYRAAGLRQETSKLNSFIDENGAARDPFISIPASVSAGDRALGVYRVSFIEDVDQPGSVLDTLPGEPVEDLFLIDGMERGATPLGREGLYAAQGLKPDWECSVTMTVRPLEPNSNLRNWRERFEQPDGFEPGQGPAIIVHQNSDTARFALPDGLARYRDPNRAGGTPDPDDAVESNARFNGDQFVNRKVITAIGFAETDRIYRSWVDQLEGSVEYSLTQTSKNLRPRASLTNIQYAYSKSGRVGVKVSASRVPVNPNIENLLPLAVLRLVKQQLKF